MLDVRGPLDLASTSLPMALTVIVDLRRRTTGDARGTRSPRLRDIWAAAQALKAWDVATRS